jgi:predicted HicB family RNase H-like nuclease
MNDVIEYKGFLGSVRFSADDGVFYGKIEGTDDLVSFEGSTVAELTDAFREAVDDYIGLCAKTGKRPEKSFKGSFNVRIRPELHRLAFRHAPPEGRNPNPFCRGAVARELRESPPDYGK